MSPASSFALRKVIGLCLLIWLVLEVVSWLSDQVARFETLSRAYAEGREKGEEDYAARNAKQRW